MEHGILTLPAESIIGEGKWELGWRFSVGNADLTVKGLRVYLPDNQTVTANIWGSSNLPIASVTITATADSWCSANFSTPIVLEAGENYIISCYNDVNRYYCCASSDITFNSAKLTYDTGICSQTQGQKPDIVVADIVYPYVDLLIKTYKSSGTAVYTIEDYEKGGNDRLVWNSQIPTGTSVTMYTKVNNGSWRQISYGGAIQGLPNGTCTLYVKAELATTNNLVTPTLTKILVKSDVDLKTLTLTSAIPNFSSAIGNMTVSYDGLGGLKGVGGPSPSFTGRFTPRGLTWKGHQNDEEHIEMNTSVNINLMRVTYNDTQESEHMEMSVSATIVLTNIHDL